MNNTPERMRPRGGSVIAEAVRGVDTTKIEADLAHARKLADERADHIRRLEAELRAAEDRARLAEEAAGEGHDASLEHLQEAMRRVAAHTIAFIQAAKIGRTSSGGSEAAELAEVIRGLPKLLGKRAGAEEGDEVPVENNSKES